jgi:ATP-dependent Clp protease ATP-binding subunit ClpA
MMFGRLRSTPREVIVRAKRESEEMRHPWIGTEHLLLALLDEQAGIAYSVLHRSGVDRQRVRTDIERLVRPSTLGAEDAAALRTIGIDLDAVLARIEESFGPGAARVVRPPARRGPRRFSPRARNVWALSVQEATELGHRYLGPEHLLLGLIREGGGLAAKILTDAGLSLRDLRTATLAALREAA